MAFLDWKRACMKYNINPQTLNHIFITVIQTPETAEVFKHIFSRLGRTLNDLGDFPTWEHKLTFMPDTDDGKALMATAQLKGVFWMLMQHREELGRKTFDKIFVFKDDDSGSGDEVPLRDRGPTMHVMLKALP